MEEVTCKTRMQQRIPTQTAGRTSTNKSQTTQQINGQKTWDRHFTNGQQTYDKAFNIKMQIKTTMLLPHDTIRMGGTWEYHHAVGNRVSWYIHLSYGQYELNPRSSNSIPSSMPIRNTYAHPKTCKQTHRCTYTSQNLERVHPRRTGIQAMRINRLSLHTPHK